MKNIPRLATAGGIAGAVITVMAGTALAAEGSHTEDWHHHGHGDNHRAVFVQTDNKDGNAIVAYHRDDGGVLTETGSYPTGGLGGALGGAVVDFPASQGSLIHDSTRDQLYAVNPGSDTITVFDVHGDQLKNPQVVPSGGRFPVSVTTHQDLVYALNARNGGSLQGFRWDGYRLTSVPGWHRNLGLGTDQTPEFTHTPGQVAFTPDGRKLVITTKAATHQVLIFDVRSDGGLADTPVVTTLDGAVPFAVTFASNGNLAVAEVGFNAIEMFTINRDGTLTSLGRNPTGQAGTCWVTRSGKYLYASNAGSSSITGFSARRGTLTLLGHTPTNPGTVDAAASPDGANLYVQTGRNGIVDTFAISPDGSLTPNGSVTVPNAAGGEGIVAT